MHCICQFRSVAQYSTEVGAVNQDERLSMELQNWLDSDILTKSMKSRARDSIQTNHPT